jgi:hypothetical protein
MEITLNIAWAVLTIYMFYLWLRFAPRNGAGRRTGFAGLAVLIFILAPAISITDDLLAAQRPAVVECWLRRDHQFASAHSLLPTAAAPPLPVFAGLSLGVWQAAERGDYTAPFVASPALAPIQNRPPPLA